MKVIEIYRVLKLGDKFSSEITKKPENKNKLIEDINSDTKKYKHVGLSYTKEGVEVNYKNTNFKYNPDNGSAEIRYTL